MVQSNGWSIVLHPTTNTFQEVLSCRIPGAYRELTLDAAVFAAATNEEIFKLRGLAFNYINSHRVDYFWKKIIDDGVFHDDRKGDLKVKDLR